MTGNIKVNLFELVDSVLKRHHEKMKELKPVYSNCCVAKAIVMCGRYSYDPELEYKEIPRGKTYWWECTKCKKACDGHSL